MKLEKVDFVPLGATQRNIECKQIIAEFKKSDMKYAMITEYGGTANDRKKVVNALKYVITTQNERMRAYNTRGNVYLVKVSEEE